MASFWAGGVVSAFLTLVKNYVSLCNKKCVGGCQ